MSNSAQNQSYRGVDPTTPSIDIVRDEFSGTAVDIFEYLFEEADSPLTAHELNDCLPTKLTTIQTSLFKLTQAGFLSRAKADNSPSGRTHEYVVADTIETEPVETSVEEVRKQYCDTAAVVYDHIVNKADQPVSSSEIADRAELNNSSVRSQLQNLRLANIIDRRTRIYLHSSISPYEFYPAGTEPDVSPVYENRS